MDGWSSPGEQMSIEIDVICSNSPDVPVGCKVVDLVLGHCLDGYIPLKIEFGEHAVSLLSRDAKLTVISVASQYHEFPGKQVVSVRSETRCPYSYLVCFLLSSTFAYCFDGNMDMDNWLFSSYAEPSEILGECLRHERADAQWLLDRLASI